MRKIIRIAIVAVAAAALLLACDDKAAEPETTADVVATPTEPAAPPPSAEELEATFAKEAKEKITADNADTIAADLEKEIDGDTE